MIDPNGDVIVTLNNTNAEFAIWDEAAAPGENQDSPAEPITFCVSSRHPKLR
jgi:hypothetical protein